MRMRKLNSLSYQVLKLGDVITIKYPDGRINIGVVYGIDLNDPMGTIIRCNTQKYGFFSIKKAEIEKGDIQFSIMKMHAPIAQFGDLKIYDFVSNHK